MSAQVTITQLPSAGAITGAEAVPIVQNGVTVQTTVAAIAAAPSQTYSYLTVTQTPNLPNSRYVGATNGLVLTDSGAQGLFNIGTTGALLSLVGSGTGFQVKTSSTAITGRYIATSGTGLSTTNGDGILGNPTIALTGQILNLANASFNGFVVLNTAGSVTSTTLTVAANQLSITNPNGIGNPLFSIADNPIVPGAGSMTIPQGTTTQRPSIPQVGMFRYDTTLGGYYGYSAGAWRQFSLAGGVTLVNTGTGLSGGPITGVGTISIANTTVTAAAYGSATQVGTFTVNDQGQLTAAASVTISASGIGAVTTVNGTANEVTSSGTSVVTLSLPTALTFTGKTITGGTFSATTVTGATQSGGSINNAAIGNTTANTGNFTALTSTSASVAGDTVTTNTATQTLTNKTISGANNTLANIANASLINSSVTVGATAIALGASSLTLGGLTSVSVTQDPVSALQLTTKQYVDAVAQGLDPKASCVAATTANITLSGTQTIDGVALIAGDRCLVFNQTLSQNNGIYLVAASAWTRALDMDVWTEVPGAFTFIEQGTLYADTGWVCTSNAGGTLGTTPITFVQFAGAGSYTAGTGLTLAGTQFSVTNTAVTAAAYGSATQVGTFTVNAQGQLTLASSVSIAISGNQITSGTVAVANGGTGVTTSTGTTNVVLSNSPTLVSPALGTPSALVGTNITGTATAFTASNVTTNANLTGAITSVGNAASLGSFTSAQLATALTDETGTGANVFATSPTLITPALGTPSSGTMTNVTGLPLTTGVTGILAITNGGTNSTATATAGGIAYGTGAAYAFTIAGTAGQILTSTGSGAPVFAGISGGTF